MTEEELVRRYGSMVYNLALRLTGNRADAEDLAQEALIKGVQGLSSFRGEADPGTWLMSISTRSNFPAMNLSIACWPSSASSRR